MPHRALRVGWLAAFGKQVKLAALGCALGGGAFAQQPEMSVQLSPFHVLAATAEFQHWGKYRTPNFVLYTDAGPDAAAQVMLEMEMVALSVDQILRRPPANLPPIIVVLPTAMSDWRRLEATRGSEWQAAAAVANGKPQTLVTVSYNWQGEGRSLVWSSVAKAVLTRADWHGPFWFSMGFGALFEAADIDRESLLLRPLRQDWGKTLASTGWLPWLRFLQVSSDSREFLENKGVDRFLAQAALTAHWFLFQTDSGKLARLSLWRNYQLLGVVPEESVFRQVTGLGFAEWSREMRAYARRRPARKFAADAAGAERFSARNENLSTREMRELFVLAQLFSKRDDPARAALDVLVQQGVRTASLRALLPSACLADGRFAAALAGLREEIAAGTGNALVYELAADLRFRRLVPDIRLDTRLTPEDAAELQAWGRRALELEPSLIDAARTLAWVEALSPEVSPASVGWIESLRTRLALRAGGTEISAAAALVRYRLGDRAGGLSRMQELSRELDALPVVPRLAREMAAAQGT